MIQIIHETGTIKLLKNNHLIGHILYEIKGYPHLKEVVFSQTKYKKHHHFRKLLNYFENEMKILKFKRIYADINDDYYASDFDKAEYYYELKNQYYLKFIDKGSEKN